MSDDETVYEHPAQVLVSFSRRQGSPGPLFGSHLARHESYITLNVGTGQRIHDNRLGYDRYYGSLRGGLIEIDLSAAQFAELITTMNIGTGVPGTLRYFDGKQIERYPETDTEAEKVRSNFASQMKKVVGDAKKSKSELQGLLETKKTLSQADRQNILRLVERVIGEVESAAPYIHERFEEAVEKTVQQAKAEIENFTTLAAITTGLKQLQENYEANRPLLTTGESDDGDPA